MKGSSILLATDFSEASAAAARWAQTFAKSFGLEVVATHVVTISVGHWARGAYDVLDRPEMMAKAQKRLAAWYSEATGVAPDRTAVRVGHAPVQLAEAVDEHDAALVVVSSSGKGPWQKLFLGSTAQALATNPPCPVAIIPPEHADLPTNPQIAVGVDFSGNCRSAIRQAAALCKVLDGDLYLVHADTSPVIDVLDDDDLAQEYISDGHYEWAQEEMQQLVEAHQADLDGVDYHTEIIEDYPARGLLNFVRAQNIDLLAVGRAGHGPLVNSVLGGVLQKTLQSVPTATLIVAEHDRA